MYGVIRQYKVEPGTIARIVDRAQTGFLPLVTALPGFVSYRFVDVGADGVVTVSTFENQATAEESTRAAAGWVKENLAGLITSAPQVTSGEMRIREVRPGAALSAAIMRRYQFDPGDIEELVKRVQAGLVPKITAAAGFGAYAVLDAGGGTVISLSAFADQAAADASQTLATDWVKENLAPFLKTPPQVTRGTIKLSRP